MARINDIHLHYVLEGAKQPVLTLINMASHNLTCWKSFYSPYSKTIRCFALICEAPAGSGWGDDAQFNLRNTQTILRVCCSICVFKKPLCLDSPMVPAQRLSSRCATRPTHWTCHVRRGLTPPVDQGDQGALGAQAAELLQAAGRTCLYGKSTGDFTRIETPPCSAIPRTSVKATPMHGYTA